MGVVGIGWVGEPWDQTVGHPASRGTEVPGHGQLGARLGEDAQAAPCREPVHFHPVHERILPDDKLTRQSEGRPPTGTTCRTGLRARDGR